MTLKLEVGKTYVDYAGRKVQIVHESQIPHHLTPFLGIILLTPNEEMSKYYGVTGNQGGDDRFDLVKEYKIPTYRWLPLYRQGSGVYSVTLDGAVLDKTKLANDYGWGFIGIYRVDLNNGDITKVED